MGSQHVRADVNVAWPASQIAVMGAAGAAKIIHRREIAAAEDPAALEAQRAAEYEEKFGNPYRAAARGFIDDVIEERDTRPYLIRSLELMRSKHESRHTR